MARLCKRGHDLDEVGVAANQQCRVCRRACDAAWHAKQYDEMTGYERNQRLLRGRRNKALKRIAKRNNEEV